jgi:hypothetical protein
VADIENLKALQQQDDGIWFDTWLDRWSEFTEMQKTMKNEEEFPT